MRKSSQRQDQIEALLLSIRKLLATRPQFTLTPTSGPMRGIEFSEGRLAITYLAHAEQIEGRLRASAPHSLNVRFDSEIVLSIRWKNDRRKNLAYVPGPWERRLEFLARK